MTDAESIMKYNDFLHNNRIKVNKYLNRALWFFVLTGPAIASGIKGGIFTDISYRTCIYISLTVIILSVIHLALFLKFPAKTFTCVFALTALNILICYMSYAHVSIYITWFLVPLLSLLFCDKYLHLYATVMNYILMLTATWFSAPYEATLRNGYESTKAYFSDIISGFTIEYIIMFIASYTISKLILEYFKGLFDQYKEISEKDAAMKEKVELLDSMAEIYDNVNLIDFTNNTEMSLRDSEQKKHGIDMNAQTLTLMNQRIKNQVMPDQLEEFMSFTNIKTLRSRLSHKKLISADFIDVVSGWFRAQYIPVKSTLDGIPNVVIYTTRNVDEEKRREEHLIRISMTDEMTRLFNRRCFDEDLREIRSTGLSEDFVLFSIDVNGLKAVNDSKGHAAGDELIKGAANCLTLSIGNKGKAYRTGGDEFIAMVHSDDPEKIRNIIKSHATEWRGMYSDELTMSIGYAAHSFHTTASVDELERIADAEMYKDKSRYYRERGIDRRH